MAEAILSQSGIYAITNKTNGKQYIGSAKNVTARWRRHRQLLAKGTHHSIKLQRAWLKYGAEAFEFSVLELVDDVESLVAREQHWLDCSAAAHAGYNICKKAGSILGVKRSPETLAKMRQSGLKYRASDETREKLRRSNTGKKATPEKLAKMRALVKSPETIEKLRIAGTGRKLSEESIAKMIAFNTGLKKSDAAKEKMRQAKLGTKQPRELVEKRMAAIAATRLRKKMENEKIKLYTVSDRQQDSSAPI